ncbi:indole-3-glycerol phosphate synthase TrpC [Desulfovibrio legallii]|uniref:indole-3-glycerol-phosphate synthase n=1 Tax=Desulfovibrio legallii TaxID=571438 RepID=A0A1G7N2I8_9BACT|nr:indole-3-glycerol-phosphate synthase [Desulfovibrio legallii]SDF68127.1 indole-3-glycerol phosphate synthase [Desulfovibrio legallii]
MLLERFRAAKREELAALRALEARGALPAPLSGPRPSFTAALRAPGRGPLAVIAEYKRASPSRGVICEALEVEDVAAAYRGAGAAALSILTEEAHFHGSLGYLTRAAVPALYAGPRPPLLRKDFIFDALQVRATAATPASALLLIVRLTPEAGQLRALRELAESSGLEAVVEVFDAADLRLARESGARLIQVNARDLEKLTVDREACLTLARACPPRQGELWIAASGLSRPEHLRAAADAGYAAALVGGALMEGGRPGAALRALLAPGSPTEEGACS